MLTDFGNGFGDVFRVRIITATDAEKGDGFKAELFAEIAECRVCGDEFAVCARDFGDFLLRPDFEFAEALASGFGTGFVSSGVRGIGGAEFV